MSTVRKTAFCIREARFCLFRKWSCALFICSALLVDARAHAQEWPTINLPKDVQAFDIGSQVSVNGAPMRMRGFIADAKPESLAEWFRKTLGSPLVESSLGGKTILGRAHGAYYLTVQLERAGAGTRGIVEVTDLKAGYEARLETQEQVRKWLSKMPSGSRLLGDVKSQDDERLSHHFVFVNTYGETINQGYLKRLMEEEGLSLEKTGKDEAQVFSSHLKGGMAGKNLYFKGSSKQAMATILRNGNGETYIVLNLVNSIRRFK
jgi:hypothetical protein